MLFDYLSQKGFPDSSVGKESTCYARDLSSIPGLGRFAREGIGYPLQYFWASLVAQLVKNPPAMRETWVKSLGWEDPLEKGKATHSSILAWRSPWTVHGVAKSWTQLSDFHFTSLVAQLVKNLSAMQRPGFDPWVGKIPWRRGRLPTPVFWPGEFHGQSMGSQRVGHN